MGKISAFNPSVVEVSAGDVRIAVFLVENDVLLVDDVLEESLA
jgi:hypothetical protein